MIKGNSISTHWQSTKSTEPPSGKAQKGTFRDIDIDFLSIGWVDRVDSNCIESGIPRSEYFQLALQLADANPELLMDTTANTRKEPVMWEAPQTHTE